MDQSTVHKFRLRLLKRHQPPCESIKIPFIVIFCDTFVEFLMSIIVKVNGNGHRYCLCASKLDRLKENYNIFTFRKSSGVDRKSWEHFFLSFICITVETRGHTKLEIARQRMESVNVNGGKFRVWLIFFASLYVVLFAIKRDNLSVIFRLLQPTVEWWAVWRGWQKSRKSQHTETT